MKVVNTDWTNIPHTDKNATIKRHRRVVDVLAIRVFDASIRNATVSDVFELADVKAPVNSANGAITAEVKCCWNERKPPTSWMHLTLNHEWEVIKNFSGNVADNIE